MSAAKCRNKVYLDVPFICVWLREVPFERYRNEVYFDVFSFFFFCSGLRVLLESRIPLSEEQVDCGQNFFLGGLAQNAVVGEARQVLSFSQKKKRKECRRRAGRASSFEHRDTSRILGCLGGSVSLVLARKLGWSWARSEISASFVTFLAVWYLSLILLGDIWLVLSPYESIICFFFFFSHCFTLLCCGGDENGCLTHDVTDITLEEPRPAMGRNR